MLQRNGVQATPPLDLEAWRASLRTICGRYSPQGIERDAFQGWARMLNVCGLAAVDIGWNARRIERTYRDARLDGMEHYYVRIQVSGKSAMIQNDRARRIAVGDVVLVDAARPVTYFGNSANARWVSLQLPRQSLISYLGFEPQGGACRRGGTPAGRFLIEAVVDALKGEGSSSPPADSYMQLAVHDLVGALFAPSDTPSISRSTDKRFARICGVIKDSLPILISGLSGRPPKWGSRYAMFKSSLRNAARLAVNSSIRSAWTAPRTFCAAARYFGRANRSARSPMPAAFATMRISHENFVIGSVIRRARTPEIVME
jgi:AraC-binding-like domain